MKLSPNFTLDELITSGAASRLNLDNTPSPEVTANLTRLARFLEKVKALVGGKPIMVSSGYRSPALNKAIGGAATSQHCKGCAADFKVPGMTPDQLVRLITMSSLEYDQVIREFDSWVHISVPNDSNTAPRKQALIIDKQGTRPYK